MFKRNWRSLTKRIAETLIGMTLLLALVSCAQQPKGLSMNNALKSVSGALDRELKVEEVSPPPVIQELRLALDQYHPKVKILGPKPNTVIEETTLTVQFDVDDFPLFKDPDLGLGPHLHVFLDDRPYQALYDASQSLTFKDLSPGTHMIRAFASRPWHESVKTPGAYDQLTFHVFAPTQANHPTPDQVLLTYSRPEGVYGAEPILLDYYLTPPVNAKSLTPQKVRVSLNGKGFTTDEWTPVYLKGFKPGSNWVKLELLDENDKLANNVYSEALRVIQFNPKGQDGLARLVRGDLTAKDAERIVDFKVSQRLEMEKRETEKREREKRETKPISEPSSPPKAIAPPVLSAPEVMPSPVASPKVIPTPAAIAVPSPQPVTVPTVMASPTVKPKPRVVLPTPTPSAVPTSTPRVTPNPVDKLATKKIAIPSPSGPKSIDVPAQKPTAEVEPPFWSKFNPKQFLEEKTAQVKDQVQKTLEPSATVPSVPTKVPAIAKPDPAQSPEAKDKPVTSVTVEPSVPQKTTRAKTAIPWQDFLQFKPSGNTEKLPMVQPTEAPVVPERFFRRPETLVAPSSPNGETGGVP